MQFLGKFGKFVCWRPRWGVGAPPRGNPGSATDYLYHAEQCAVNRIHALSNWSRTILLCRSLLIRTRMESMSRYAMRSSINIASTTSGGSRIFPRGAPTPKIAIIFQIFAENCMKMKEFGPGGRPWRPLGSANDYSHTRVIRCDTKLVILALKAK